MMTDLDILSVLAVMMMMACAIELVKVRKELLKHTKLMEEMMKKPR